MEAIAGTNIRFVEARLKHGLHGSDGREQARSEGQLERTVTTTRDAGNDGGVTNVPVGAEAGDQVAGKEGIPANGAGGVLHVEVEAGRGGSKNHRGNGAVCPPFVKHRLEVEQHLARAAGA